MTFLQPSIQYSIEIEKFSGPFDTLLDLVKKHKLNLLDLDLNELTNQYLAFLDENIQAMNFEQASEYMLIASKLLAMKIKYINEQMIEEQDIKKRISDEDLIKNLITYKLYKDVVPKLNQKYFERQLKCDKEKGNFEIFSEKPASDYKLKDRYDIQKLADAYTKTLQIFQHQQLSHDFNIKVKDINHAEVQNTLVKFIHNHEREAFSLLEYFYQLNVDNQTVEYFCSLFVSLLYQIKNGAISYILVRDDIDITFRIIDKTKAVKIEGEF